MVVSGKVERLTGGAIEKLLPPQQPLPPVPGLDTSCLDPATIRLDEVWPAAWVNATSRGTPPCGRSRHSAIVSGHHMIVFGGIGVCQFNDLYALDLSLDVPVWRSIPTTGKAPEPRDGHAMAPVRDKGVILFGGWGMHRKNDVFTLAISHDPNEPWKWHRPRFSGRPPSARDGHTAITLDTDFLIFGGHQGGDTYFGDLHKLDLVTMTWTTPETSGVPPRARMGHSANGHGRHMVVYGGICGDETYTDLHILDTGSYTWTEYNFKPTPASMFARTVTRPRRHHEACMVGQKLYITGGWKNLEPSGKAEITCDVIDLDRMCVYEPKLLSDCPSARIGFSLCEYDKKLILFGGVDARISFDELFIMNTAHLDKVEAIYDEVQGWEKKASSWNQEYSAHNENLKSQLAVHKNMTKEVLEWDRSLMKERQQLQGMLKEQMELASMMESNKEMVKAEVESLREQVAAHAGAYENHLKAQQTVVSSVTELKKQMVQAKEMLDNANATSLKLKAESLRHIEQEVGSTTDHLETVVEAHRRKELEMLMEQHSQVLAQQEELKQVIQAQHQQIEAQQQQLSQMQNMHSVSLNTAASATAAASQASAAAAAAAANAAAQPTLNLVSSRRASYSDRTGTPRSVPEYGHPEHSDSDGERGGRSVHIRGGDGTATGGASTARSASSVSSNQEKFQNMLAQSRSQATVVSVPSSSNEEIRDASEQPPVPEKKRSKSIFDRFKRSKDDSKKDQPMKNENEPKKKRKFSIPGFKKKKKSASSSSSSSSASEGVSQQKTEEKPKRGRFASISWVKSKFRRTSKDENDEGEKKPKERRATEADVSRGSTGGGARLERRSSMSSDEGVDDYKARREELLRNLDAGEPIAGSTRHEQQQSASSNVPPWRQGSLSQQFRSTLGPKPQAALANYSDFTSDDDY